MTKKASGKGASKKSQTDSSPDISTENDVDDVDVEPTVGVSNPPEARSAAQSQAHDTVHRITEVVITALDALADGEKTTLKELQTLVAEQTGLKGSNIGPVISMIVKTHGGVTVELGRYGGIYKGVRVKPEKVPDNKPRCAHCNQVIRQKTGPRKKKDATGTLTAAATTSDASSPDLEEEDDEDFEEEDDNADDSENEANAN